jgi:hypothetical protein
MEFMKPVWAFLLACIYPELAEGFHAGTNAQTFSFRD